MILTLFLWAGLFGIFTKGGRGFCNFLCPVGAVQNLLYSFSSRLPFVYRLIIDRKNVLAVKAAPCLSYGSDGDRRAESCELRT